MPKLVLAMMDGWGRHIVLAMMEGWGRNIVLAMMEGWGRHIVLAMMEGWGRHIVLAIMVKTRGSWNAYRYMYGYRCSPLGTCGLYGSGLYGTCGLT